ncbi:hypothetical protein H634G_11302 [Metarhizium anisopliae BRIP 53293]|uniref:Uncharacterized protein n=1 Tax=Metarhizium anisopliae BRIP 53293 TaxID=1291518 RepID=A0A0D9NLG7_METAN|nr:hypothetical protein H634G_11302 [Metarhizium anisopliae BRIP 53293]
MRFFFKFPRPPTSRRLRHRPKDLLARSLQGSQLQALRLIHQYKQPVFWFSWCTLESATIRQRFR